MPERSFRFTHAITRRPPVSAIHGLRAENVGNPDIDLMMRHHDAYVTELRQAGVEVSVLDALEEFPDSLFVEDTALCVREGAVVLRPGAPSRFGESMAMAPHLKDLYSDVRHLAGPGFIEGGDILTTESEILVGKSDRTNTAGIEELQRAVADWGYTVREVRTPPEFFTSSRTARYSMVPPSFPPRGSAPPGVSRVTPSSMLPRVKSQPQTVFA